MLCCFICFFFFSSRRRHTRLQGDWSSDVCSSDLHGFVSNLGEQDFEVYENGVPQHIRLFRNEDIPVTVGLVVDQSTSMRPKLEEVSAAARSFVRYSNRDDEMFVVNFNEIVSLG